MLRLLALSACLLFACSPVVVGDSQSSNATGGGPGGARGDTGRTTTAAGPAPGDGGGTGAGPARGDGGGAGAGVSGGSGGGKASARRVWVVDTPKLKARFSGFDDIEGSDRVTNTISELTEAGSITFDRMGRIYGVENNHDVFRMDDASGAGLVKLGGFSLPNFVAVDASYRIYVTDSSRAQVVRIDDITGAGSTKFGTQGTTFGTFNWIRGIAVAPDGKIIVADQDRGVVIQVDDMTGAGWTEWTMPRVAGKPWPTPVVIDAMGRIYIGDHVSGVVHRIDDISGSGHVSLSLLPKHLTYLAVDSAGGIWGAQDGEHGVVAHADDMAGTNLQVFDGGSGSLRFHFPFGIAAQ